jgi:hypothetical protein
VGVRLFSSPFDRFSFAHAPSSFALLKTIVRPEQIILRKRLRNRDQGTGIRNASRLGSLFML